MYSRHTVVDLWSVHDYELASIFEEPGKCQDAKDVRSGILCFSNRHLTAFADGYHRWKRCLFAFRDGIVICNMKDEKDYYRYNVDSVKKTYTLHDNPDTTTWKVFNYSFPGKDRLLLNGKWKGREVSVMMRSIPADSMRLNKEKIRLIQD